MSVQEHFQSQFSGGRKTTGKAAQVFSDNFTNYKSYVIPAVRAPDVIQGRAAGGLAQLTRKDVDVYSERVSTDNSHLQAQVLHFPTCKLLWVNVYMPDDTRAARGNFDDTKLVRILSDIEMIMDRAVFDHCCVQGDWNFDPSRRSGFAEIVKGNKVTRSVSDIH